VSMRSFTGLLRVVPDGTGGERAHPLTRRHRHRDGAAVPTVASMRTSSSPSRGVP
jgi:hypothetical protein